MAKQATFFTITAVIVTLFFLQMSQVSGIKGGNQSLRSEWPFVVALYHAGRYYCGGTLVSNKHVLTAAHCIQSKLSNQIILPDIVVKLGVYNLTEKDEEGVLERNVSDIYIHPDWNVYSAAYDADLAILLLSEKVEFSNSIQIVPLPGDEIVIDGKTIDVNGTIVGWGNGERGFPEEIRKQARVRALNGSGCYIQHPFIAYLSSNRTFCGIYGNGLANRGDGGGGFFVDSGSGWVQYGVLSAVSTDNTGRVTIHSAGVCTNVKSFKTWILEILN